MMQPSDHVCDFCGCPTTPSGDCGCPPEEPMSRHEEGTCGGWGWCLECLAEGEAADTYDLDSVEDVIIAQDALTWEEA